MNDRTKTIIICSAVILFGIIVKVLPMFYSWQGQNFLAKKDYVKAHSALKKAYTLNRGNKDIRYFYVQSLNHLSPNVEVQKEVFQIAYGKQNDSAQQSAENKINEWRNNILRNIGDNYIEQTPLDNRILRWDTTKFPLKIYVANESGVAIPDYYETEISRAFNQWQNSTGFIKFAKPKNPSDANIIIRIKPLPNNVCDGKECKYVVGFTTPEIKHNQLKRMNIVLYAKDPYGNFFSDKELFNTILHEIGHALGIMGHSYSSEDLMYMASGHNSVYSPYRSSFQYLSSKDVNTIKLLYKLIPDITNSEKISTKGLIYAPIVLGTSKEISQRKLKEAQNYVKNAPELTGGYVDLAIAYAELGKTKDAIKSANIATQLAKTENEKYVAYYNLAAIYMNSKDYDKALEAAERAKSISNNEEIKTLILQINHCKRKK